jgi:hypothetical protein
MYADDTTLSINGKNIFEIEATLNEYLNSVNMWCTNNNVVINPTNKLCFRSDKYDSNHFIGSQTAAAYSIVGRTKVVNARSFADWGQVPMFLLKKAKVLFAFFEAVKYGVPQGSILESLLFIIFINDLPLENLTSKIDMYADDTTLSINGKNIFEIEATLNEDLNIRIEK